METKESNRFRHTTLSSIMITLAIISAITAGILGFGFNLYYPTIACMGLTLLTLLYVGLFEKN